jgi:hypothetical protein
VRPRGALGPRTTFVHRVTLVRLFVLQVVCVFDFDVVAAAAGAAPTMTISKTATIANPALRIM